MEYASRSRRLAAFDFIPSYADFMSAETASTEENIDANAFNTDSTPCSAMTFMKSRLSAIRASTIHFLNFPVQELSSVFGRIPSESYIFFWISWSFFTTSRIVA